MARKPDDLFGTVYEEYLNVKAAEWRPVTTAHRRASYLYMFGPVLGRRKLRSIGPRDIQAVLARPGLAASSRRLKRAELAAFFNWAVAMQLVPSSPVAPVKIQARPGRRGIALTTAEAANLLRAAREVSAPAHGLFLFALYTGLRRKNLLELTPDHIWRGIVQFPGYAMKNGYPLELPLHPILAKVRLPFGYGRGWCEDTLGKVRSHAGLPSAFRLHDCRHTFASWLAQVAPMPVVAALLGHVRADNSMTALYCHVTLEQKREALLKLPRLS